MPPVAIQALQPPIPEEQVENPRRHNRCNGSRPPPGLAEDYPSSCNNKARSCQDAQDASQRSKAVFLEQPRKSPRIGGPGQAWLQLEQPRGYARSKAGGRDRAARGIHQR